MAETNKTFPATYNPNTQRPASDRVVAEIKGRLPEYASAQGELAAAMCADIHFLLNERSAYNQMNVHKDNYLYAEEVAWKYEASRKLPTTDMIGDLLNSAGAITVTSEGGAGSARVEIRFSQLRDAQRLHQTLVAYRAARSR